jgi:hypothetical protein
MSSFSKKRKRTMLALLGLMGFVALGLIICIPRKLSHHKTIKYVAYMGRYSNIQIKDSIPIHQQKRNRFDLFHETVLKHYLEVLNKELTYTQLELKTFDCMRDPKSGDSIYKNHIATDTNIVLVVDNTWGIELMASANTIRENKIPMIAINGDKNNLDFGPHAIFTGNNDMVPYDISSFITRALEVKKINFITETDYPLHQTYLRAFGQYGIQVDSMFTLLGKPEVTPHDSILFFSKLLTYYQSNPEKEDEWLVINTHMDWGNRIIRFIDQHCTRVNLLGHAYITNASNAFGFGKDNNNQLILITNPTDAMSEPLTKDLAYFRKNFPDQFDFMNAPLYLNRCNDVMNIIRGKFNFRPDTTGVSRAGFAQYFASLAHSTLVANNDLYEFDSSLVCIPELHFSSYKAGGLYSYPKQMNSQREVIPNLFFGMEMLDLYDIDMNSNSFSADFYYWVKLDTGNRAAEKYILFQNMKQSESSKELILESEDLGILYKLYKVSGKFYVNYQLADYPLDKQELAITVEIISPVDNLKISFDQSSFTQDENLLKKFKVNAWEKLNYYVTVDSKISSTMRGDPNNPGNRLNKYKSFSFRLMVKRHFLGPLLQVILPLIMIGFIAISMMFVRDISFGNLGEVVAGIFLSIIAFSIALSEFVPRSSQLTKADLLFWITFTAVFISFMTVIIVNSIYTKSQVKKKNIKPLSITMAFLYVVSVLYVLIS